MTNHYSFKDPELSDKQRGIFTATCLVPVIMLYMALALVEFVLIGTWYSVGALIGVSLSYVVLIGVRSYHHAKDEIERRKEYNENPPVKEIIQTQTKHGYENLYYYAEPLEIEPVSVYWKRFFKQLLWIR